jgi:hypothetical protein
MVRTGGALAGVAAAASGAVAAHAGVEQGDHDDGLVELCSQFDDLERQINQFYSGGPAFIADDDAREAAQEPLWAVQERLLQEICGWRASTLAGHRARARSVAAYHGRYMETTLRKFGTDGQLLAALCRDLLAGDLS